MGCMVSEPGSGGVDGKNLDDNMANPGPHYGEGAPLRVGGGGGLVDSVLGSALGFVDQAPLQACASGRGGAATGHWATDPEGAVGSPDLSPEGGSVVTPDLACGRRGSGLVHSSGFESRSAVDPKVPASSGVTRVSVEGNSVGPWVELDGRRCICAAVYAGRWHT